MVNNWPMGYFGLISLDLAKKYDDLMILTADVSTSAGLIDLENNPEHSTLE